MSRRIGRIIKLSGDKAAGDLGSQLVCFVDGALHTLCTGGQNELCAISGHQESSFHTHGIGHDDDDPVTPGSGNGSKTDACVAGGRFDNRTAGTKQTFFFSVFDHGQGDPVLYGAGGVKGFQFGKKPCLQAFFCGKIFQFHQRCVAHKLGYRSINASHKHASNIGDDRII